MKTVASQEMSSTTPSNRPIMRLIDLLGRRWVLRILWELRDGPARSRPLRQVCDGLSPTVLQARLDELRGAGLVSLDRAQGYGLTPLGQELLEAFAPLYLFAARWDRATSDEPSAGNKGANR
jgi:DNA-binding HxlR family transcriptional regulator